MSRVIRNPALHLSVLLTLCAVPLAVHAQQAKQPSSTEVPAPEARPDRAGDAPADGIEAPELPEASEAPVVEERPAEKAGDAQDDAAPTEGEKKDAAPQPDADKTDAPAGEAKEKQTDAESAPASIPDRPAAMPAEEAACRVRLTELGVRFEEREQLRDPSGCSVEWPIAVTRLSATVELEPEAVLNCATAEAVARFAGDVIAPASRRQLDRSLTSIRQDSAYVCRPRNGTQKLSEHAFGNALDFGAFKFDDGSAIEVGGAKTRHEAVFMLSLRLAACGPFKTVLGPGSDADHATHFHFDMAARRNGGAYCQ